MNRKQILSFIGILLTLALITIPAAAKSSFVGSWKMVPDKTDYGPLPLPEKLEQVIEENGADLKVSLTQVGQQGEYKVELNYNTDGKETTNELRGNPAKSKAKWEGDVLVIESKADFQGNEITINEKWSLGDSGKTLTIDRKVVMPQGEIEQKVVLSKQ